MKRLLTGAWLLCVFSLSLRAHEGMWIPAILDAAYDDMKAYGLQLTREELYSVNGSSLKDAVVLFGGGCTAEMVSPEGLMFTNHHCGLDYIQSHSSVTNDYLTHGYWAMNRSEELPCPGLTATYILRLEDVTERMLEGVKEGMTAEEAEKVRTANRKKIEEEAKANHKADAAVRAYNYGNHYFLVVSRTYRDVRLVGAPPSAIGKFGGDTDNWVWPRHTGDFSVFRVYAGKDNEPAEYAAGNKPYVPGHFFPVSLDGVHEGDYSMIYGFPGRTEHFLTSYAVDYTLNKSNPMRIRMRETSLGILDQRMRSSDKVRIQYTAKQSSISNAWKKWIGQEMGLERFDALGKKKELEMAFLQKASGSSNENAQILSAVADLYTRNTDLLMGRDGFVEYVYYGPEIFAFADGIQQLAANYDTWNKEGKLEEKLKAIRSNARNFYKDFDLETEKALFEAMTPLYKEYVMPGYGPEAFDTYLYKGKDMWQRSADIIYDKSAFSDSTRFFAMLDKWSPKTAKKLAKDPVFVISGRLFKTLNGTLRPGSQSFTLSHDQWMGRYVAALREWKLTEPYWCDANSTLRLSFGKVEGSAPRDGMEYKWFTTADGILEKYDPKNPDFELPARMVKLLEKREYGPYAEGGELHVAYTGSNHTTGGNSGSPALNAQGHLVGINFDRSWESTMSDILYSPEICRNIRSWESTMSDILYSPEICRNIMVDIRYVLWVIDVYADAGYLLDEMQLIRSGDEGAEKDR